MCHRFVVARKLMRRYYPAPRRNGQTTIEQADQHRASDAGCWLVGTKEARTVSKDSTKREQTSYCYVDYANKQNEIHAGNPWLTWLNKNRRQRAKLNVESELARTPDDIDPA